MYHFLTCDVCPCRFRVKVLKKIKVGYFKKHSVILHYFECPSCKHIHISKWNTPAVNKWTDKVFMLEWNMWMDRNDVDKCKKHSAELEIAKKEENKIISEVKKCLHLKI